MLRSVQIKIPKPCHENWNNMTPVEQGRFCSSCEKKVVDFSVMTDKELLAYISTLGGQYTCGRFSNHQLNTSIKATEGKRRLSWAYVWNVLLASLLATESYARDASSIKKKPGVHFVDAVTVTKQDTVPGNKLVKGTVLQSRTNEPVPYAYVTIKGTSKGVVCDEKGEFKIMIESNNPVTLEIMYVGYTTKKLVINENSPVQYIRVLMEEAITEMQGAFIVVQKPTFKQKVKRFFRRTFIAPFKKL